MATTTEDRPPSVEERYAAAISHGSVGANPRTSMSGGDVVAAMGIADRELTEGKVRRRDHETGEVFEEGIRPAPLAVSLERLLTGGDNRAASAIVASLTEMAWRQARAESIKLTRADANNMARIVLAWFRHGTCKPCGGHGFDLIPGTKTHGKFSCRACRGTGKRPLMKEFRVQIRPIVAWLEMEISREAGRAGPRAMAHLSEKMDLG
jgi:hypothetical protein